MTEASETFHHWKIFADGMDGVCIEFHKDRLETHLRNAVGVEFGLVEYVKLDQIAEVELGGASKLPFIKRAGYRDEKEYRIIYGSEQEIYRYDVPFTPECINRIILSPFLPIDLADATKKTLKAIEVCKDKRVIKSHLINSETWQRRWTRRLSDKTS